MQKKGLTAVPPHITVFTHEYFVTLSLKHTYTHCTFLSEYSTMLFPPEGEPVEKKLRSELKHDSCSVSLCWDFSEGESGRLEEEVGERLYREKDTELPVRRNRHVESLVRKVQTRREKG